MKIKGVILDTLCGDCPEKEYIYEYHFPHPEAWYWYCRLLKVKLTNHSGIRKNVRCPKILSPSHNGGGE